MEQAEVRLLLIRLNGAICLEVGSLGWGLRKNLILMCFPGTDGRAQRLRPALLAYGGCAQSVAGAVSVWCGTCSLPLEDEHRRLPAEGPQVGRVGHFWVLPIQGQGLACYRAWMRNVLAFSAFSCELVPNSGAVLYPLLFS